VERARYVCQVAGDVDDDMRWVHPTTYLHLQASRFEITAVALF